MIRRLTLIALALWLLAGSSAETQQNQCRTVPPGTVTSYCASEATVAQSRGTLPSGSFASLAACSSSTEGQTADVTDSSTDVFGATITGGGSFHVLAYCNGTNWTVAGGGVSPGTVTSVGASGLAVASPAPITSTGTITVTAAVKANQTTATSNSVAVTPVVQQFHPSAAKAWVNFSGSGTNGAQTVNASYNVSGVSRNSAGNYTISFSVSFTTAFYACSVSNSSLASQTQVGGVFSSAAASVIVEFFVFPPAVADPTQAMVICFGTE